MKKLLFILMLLLFLPQVNAEEINITDDISIKTKWYKEEIEGMYYPQGIPLEGYIEDPERIMYTDEYDWNKEYCDGSLNQKKRTIRTYLLLQNIRYITFRNLNYTENVILLCKGELCNFRTTYLGSDKVVLKLDSTIGVHDFIMIVNTNTPYDVTLSSDYHDLIYRNNNKEIVLIPDKTWHFINESYSQVTRIDKEEKGNFVKFLNEETQCAKQKLKTYRYKINKVYYDDEYHEYIEGYLPDYNDYKVYYNGTEIIKEKEKIKYIEKNIDNCDKQIVSCEKEEPIINTVKEIEYKYIDKIETVEKTPKNIKYLIAILIFLLLSFIGICLKMSSELNN